MFLSPPHADSTSAVAIRRLKTAVRVSLTELFSPKSRSHNTYTAPKHYFATASRTMEVLVNVAGRAPSPPQLGPTTMSRSGTAATCRYVSFLCVSPTMVPDLFGWTASRFVSETTRTGDRRSWRRAVPSRGMGAIRIPVAARSVPGRAVWPWWRSVSMMGAVAVVAAMWVLVIGGHSELRSESADSHPAHALVTSLGSEFVVNADHPHLSNGSSAAHHYEALATGVLPDSPATAAASLGVVVATVAAVGLLCQQVIMAGRGPPQGLPPALTGQDLLTRFSLSRR